MDSCSQGHALMVTMELVTARRVLPQPIDDLLKRIRPIRMMIGTVKKEMQDTAYLLCDDGTVDKKGVFVTCNTAIRLFASKTAYIFDDPAFFVNAVLYSESIMRAHGKAFLYQFDYGNVGDAFYLGPNLPKYTPEQSPHHTQEF
ncbi:unnamed protein product, partial [Anisakis simplex]|uniref:RNA-dependent RNA polymerase n=1 Tax=Anisakis simplex TaxID=6269 RepID=A0A0M3J499_ANISI